MVTPNWCKTLKTGQVLTIKASRKDSGYASFKIIRRDTIYGEIAYAITIFYINGRPPAEAGSITANSIKWWCNPPNDLMLLDSDYYI
jgi:hypothetical protein